MKLFRSREEKRIELIQDLLNSPSSTSPAARLAMIEELMALGLLEPVPWYKKLYQKLLSLYWGKNYGDTH